MLSPHVYGPSVTGTTSNTLGTDLWNRLTASFGAKSLSGVSYNGVTKRFAVAIGEFGSLFTQAVQGDVDMYADLAAYMHNQGSAAGGHTNINSWIFWCWNPTSVDTGGLVADNWLDVNWNKVDVLVGNRTANTGFNLTPWFYGA